jgi:hypothetical protein
MTGPLDRLFRYVFNLPAQLSAEVNWKELFSQVHAGAHGPQALYRQASHLSEVLEGPAQ